MGIVNINLRGINYQVACQDGQEENLLYIANKFTAKFDSLSKEMPKSTDNYLLLMTGLMLQDELDESLKSASLTPSLAISNQQEIDNSVAEAVTAIAEYIETLAEKI